MTRYDPDHVWRPKQSISLIRKACRDPSGARWAWPTHLFISEWSYMQTYGVSSQSTESLEICAKPSRRQAWVTCINITIQAITEMGKIRALRISGRWSPECTSSSRQAKVPLSPSSCCGLQIPGRDANTNTCTSSALNLTDRGVLSADPKERKRSPSLIS